MKQFSDGIPNKVLREIFPKQLDRHEASKKVYSRLKQKILSGKLKEGEKLSYDGIAEGFNVSKGIAQRIITQLKKEGLIISKDKVGLFVAKKYKENR
jgi:DNA-binding GntR family transcriptional regulator